MYTVQNFHVYACRYKLHSGTIGMLNISTHAHYVGHRVTVERCQLEESEGPVQINEETQTKHVSH